MPAETFEVQVTAADLRELLKSVRDGNEILLKDNETPVARLIPIVPPAPPRIPELHPGAIQTTEDFDAPLPDEFWTGDQ